MCSKNFCPFIYLFIYLFIYSLTLADNYQKYVDFMEALAEDDASLRISYIYRLDEFFPAELLASVIILRNIKEGDEEAAKELADKAYAGELDRKSVV